MNGMPFIFQYLFRFHRRGIFFQNRIKQIYYARNLKYHLANIIYHLDSVSFAIIIFVSIHKIFHFML